MTKPMPLSAFERLPPQFRVEMVDGLAATLDAVAEAAAPSHRFLRYGWFAAAIAAYGGHPRTVTVFADDEPVLALPLVPTGPAALGLASVPGSYWPFRSFPVAEGSGAAAYRAALHQMGGRWRAVRIGPVYDGDPGAEALIAAAREAGWAVLDRFVADSWLLDMAALRREGAWPRSSTLKKNRFHEKHLATHGTLDWQFLSADAWPDAFDALGSVEDKSWIAARTDGSDAKFTARGHGGFWRAAAADPVVAAMMRATLLRIDERPSAFSFNLDTGALRYAIANSYDPDVAKHSPGKLLQYRDLTEALDRGVARVDWGAGDSGYKQVIGAEQGPAIRDWLLLRPGLPALAGRLMRGAWRRSGHAEGAATSA